MKQLHSQIEAKEILRLMQTKDTAFWQAVQRKNSLKLFRDMAASVPAYKKFLKENGVRPANVRRYEDLPAVAPMSKKNYFHVHAIDTAVFPGSLNGGIVPICATSGSTGTPTYFARNEDFGWQFSLWLEYFMKLGRPGKTLVLDAFGLGLWMAGILTFEAAYHAGLRGNPVSIITTGINKPEIFKALRLVAPLYENVIMFGYPPFLKDIIDEARQQDVDFSKIHLRLVAGGETFTESFRDYVVEQAHIQDPVNDFANIYGCSEGGAVGWEVPTGTFIKRLAQKYPEIWQKLFGHESKVPTLAQYIPMCVMFGEENGELLLSANSVQPVLRYKVGDTGHVLHLQQIREVFKNFGVNLDKEARKAKIKLLELPFVTVYERNDFSISFYGLQIFPQTIKIALEDKALLRFLTGKFTMVTSYDKDQNQYFEINLEMKPGIAEDEKIRKVAQKTILKNLLEKNSAYRELAKFLPAERTTPRLVFWEYNHEKYFRSGTKQRWLAMPAQPAAAGSKK